MITIGLDPGRNGAIAILLDNQVAHCQPLPFIGDELDIKTLVQDILTHRAGKDCQAVLEKVHAMPGQGVCSMFSFGKTVGELRGMLKALFIPIIEVPPETWKKTVLAGTNWKGRKVASCEYIARTRPTLNLTPGSKRKPHDGMADAICLAEYPAKNKA